MVKRGGTATHHHQAHEMTDQSLRSGAWNDEVLISCEFSFKCPRSWDRLAATERDDIRYCSACERDVHLALTQEDFRRHAEEGHCLAVRVVRPESSKEAEPTYIVGSLPLP